MPSDLYIKLPKELMAGVTMEPSMMSCSLLPTGPVAASQPRMPYVLVLDVCMYVHC